MPVTHPVKNDLMPLRVRMFNLAQIRKKPFGEAHGGGDVPSAISVRESKSQFKKTKQLVILLSPNTRGFARCDLW